MAKKVINPTVKKDTGKAPVSKAAKKPAKKAKKTTRSANRKPTYTWDVVEAQKLYISDTKQSYASIAAKFGVNKKTVEDYAKKHEWVKLRQNTVEKGVKSFADKHAELISETNEEHLRIYKNARNIAYNNLVKISKAAGEQGTIDVKELNGSIYGISKAIEGERTVLGLPTVIQQFGPGKDVEQEEATWASILASVEEARKAGLTGDAGLGTEGR